MLTIHTILLVMLLVGASQTKQLAKAKYCGTFAPGMGYLLKCGKCFCDSSNKNICKRFTSYRCDPLTLWSKDFPNLCGQTNLSPKKNKTKLSLDGCNYVKCNEKAGVPHTSTSMSCSIPNNPCKSRNPGYTYKDACKSTCVCTASGVPFCQDCNTHLPWYLFSNPSVWQCKAGNHTGNGFFDRATCQTCICGGPQGQPFCKAPGQYTAYPDNLSQKCVPTTGANLTDVCGRSNMGQVYYDGCNVCKCGSISTRPVECYTKAKCYRNGTCYRNGPGYMYTSKARKATRFRPKRVKRMCICTISGRPFCKPSP